MADEEVAGEYLGEGEEQHEEAHPEEVVEEEDTVTVLTVYDSDEFFSGAVTSLDSTLPENLFEFEYSYGYNCHKYFNLCACDETVVCWSAGSIIVFMDVKTKQTWFRRSTTGGSVGNIASYRTDPNYRIAIAEGREGFVEPIIILYTWPQMEMDAVLRDGTTNAFSILDFSPDGELLGSVGKEPDYNITIWNWKRHRILLRTSAFTFDVDAILFSQYCPGQLTTAGAAHIKFWKMAQTFTGLKLKGELGRFGKFEICDVIGVYPMPDEKVLSGCEWGDVLVWEAGLVKLEVTLRGRKKMHKGPVIQFMLSKGNDEVTTIARDGCIKAWYWDTVEQADPPEDDLYVELNPVEESCVEGCQIMSLKHQNDKYWYAQDGNGGVWSMELDMDKEEPDHKKVLTTHSGPVVALVAMRNCPLLVTAGQDGALHIYHTEQCQLLARYVFETAITYLYYPDYDLDPSSCVLMIGYADGVMRTVYIHPDRLTNLKEMIEVKIHSALTIHDEDSDQPDAMILISFLKPHSKAINQITVNHQRTLVVTCGADSTIFMYQLELTVPFQLHRLGFIETPNNISYMTWKPDEERVILLCAQVGLVLEAVLPDSQIRKYSEITTFRLEFESYQETLVKKYFMRNRPFPEEEDLASIDEEALKAKEEAEKEKDEEEEEWIGEIELRESESMLGTTITWADYTEDGIWVIQRGTGCLLLIRPGSNKIYKYAPIPGSWCNDLTAVKFICDKKYLLVGTDTGYIKVMRMPSEDEDNEEYHTTVWLLSQQKLLKKLKGRRLAKEELQPVPRIDFFDNYYLPMHDFYTGAITCFDFSMDGKRMFSCGMDGNIFSFAVNFSEPLIPLIETPVPEKLPPYARVPEPSTLDGEIRSHEQQKLKEEYDKMIAIANAHKKKVRDLLAEITVEYNKVIKANRSLPYSQRIDMTLDPRPLAVQEQELSDAMALTKRKLAHQLEASDLALHKMHSRNIIQIDVFPFELRAIRDPNVIIRPLRQKNLSKAFFDQLEEVYQKMDEAARKARPSLSELLKEQSFGRVDPHVRKSGTKRSSFGPPKVASFLLGLPPRPPHPLKKAIKDYHKRLSRHHIQFIEWQEHLTRKPDPNAMPPGAERALREAEATIGNRLLKTQPDYVAPPGHNTQLKVCLMRQEIYDTKRHFNEKVLELREHKLRLADKMRKIGERLDEIKQEIPAKMVKKPPAVPDIDEDREFPEKNLEVIPEVIKTIGPKKTIERKKSGLYPQKRIRQSRVPKFLPLSVTRPVIASWELLKPMADQESSPIEIEIRERRVLKDLYEQDMLIADAEVAVQKFDARLRQLQRERVRVQEKNALLELQLIQLHREMNVLNRFEAHEDRLAERVYDKVLQVKGVEEEISECLHRISEYEDEKLHLLESCDEIQVSFKKLVGDNKFADFLRRIFKKKYKPPRDRDDDDDSEESESSSSSSEEEEEGSIDSRDIGPIRLDPTICPEGCDKDIYDKTYEMRNTRHKHEQEILEINHLIEQLNRDIEAHNKLKKKITLQLDKRKNELKEFMMEKQSCMNDVEQVVLLNYSQIRATAMQSALGPSGLSECVVFSEKTLMKLRTRVLELQDEIKMQKQKQKINRTHQHRMMIDMKAMEQSAQELRAKMRDVLTKKLGKPRQVDKTLDELLRQMARRYKFYSNLEGNLPNVREQINNWKKRYSDIEKKYIKGIETYSDKLRLAAALQSDVVPTKPRETQSDFGGYNHDMYHRDVVRLRIIKAQQMRQIHELEKEINSLRLKPLVDMKVQDEPYEPTSVRSKIDLINIPYSSYHPDDFFPITPIGSTTLDNLHMKQLLFSCLEAMKAPIDESDRLLKDISNGVADVVSSKTETYSLIDEIAKKWLLKYGFTEKTYRKQHKVIDTLGVLMNMLVKQYMDLMEVPQRESQAAFNELEMALRGVCDGSTSLQNRLAPTLAALMLTSQNMDDKDTMAALVRVLIDDLTVTQEMVDEVNIQEVVNEVKECGVSDDEAHIFGLINSTLDSIRAQIHTPQEAAEIEHEALKLMEMFTTDVSMKTSTRGDTESVKSSGPGQGDVKSSKSSAGDAESAKASSPEED